MPKQESKPTVSFPQLLRNEFGEITGTRTVNLVVVKRRDPGEENTDRSQNVILPLFGVFIGAVILVWVGSKIRPGKKTDRIINRFEGFNAFFGTDKNDQP